MCISLHIQTPRNVFKKRHHFCMICDEMLSHVFDLAFPFLFILWIINEFENVFEKWCVTSTPFKSGTTTTGTRRNGPSWTPNSSTECLTRNDWRPQITGCTKDRSLGTEQKTIRGGTIITHKKGNIETKQETFGGRTRTIECLTKELHCGPRVSHPGPIIPVA